MDNRALSGAAVTSNTADFITAAEINLYQDPAQGQTITKWASGKVTIGGSPNRVQLAYGGTALSWERSPSCTGRAG